MIKKEVTPMVWVYGSTGMPPEWRAWECLALSEAELARRCIQKYGRVPMDCVAKMAPLSSVPESFMTHEIYKYGL